jgi:thiamine monophosphate synthase
VKYGPPVGIDSIKSVKKEIGIPLYALGGIKNGNMRPIFSAGCDGVAMISAILGADDIRAAARKILDGIGLLEKIICHECGRR